MDLYLNVASNVIIGIDSEQQSEADIQLNCSSLDDFYKKISDLEYEIDESIEDNLSELFDSLPNDEDQFTIKHWVSNRSIGELIDMYECGEIMKPTMQRNLVWDSVKCSRLIESVLMGLPIPPLFMIEVDNSKYELVDGLQRLSAFTNYIYGYSWNGNTTPKTPSRLSSRVMKSIAGRSFKELTSDQQRILKRSTIPLIEFKQLEPNNNEAKYLIFERINTGSVKLTEMQIRKALAYGSFMTSLYNLANNNEAFVSLFSPTNVKKDAHVEAALRVMAMTEIYNGEYEAKEVNISKILNTYCEKKRNAEISETYVASFNQAVDILIKMFTSKKDVCRRVLPKMGQPVYSGSLQVAILEALMGTIMKKDIQNVEGAEDRYKEKMLKLYQDLVMNMDLKENPFNYSTGTREAIDKRYMICEGILLDQ